MGFVGNYVPCGLSPQTDGMPVIQKQDGIEHIFYSVLLFDLLYFFAEIHSFFKHQEAPWISFTSIFSS